MTEARTVRARVGAELAAEIDAAMQREERTESDIVRRALRAYIGSTGWTFTHTNDSTFRGPDPKVKK